MAESSIEDTSWVPWVVAPGSGFEVRDPRGVVGLVQIDRSQFLVTQPFRFSDRDVEQLLLDALVSDGKDAQQARKRRRRCRSFTPSENPSDLASIPCYMRWFESADGAHTLAAVLHDDLIVDEPNGGPLGSDMLSDTFFREMMKAAGVPWIKRWIMWAAVALRSRWRPAGSGESRCSSGSCSPAPASLRSSGRLDPSCSTGAARTPGCCCRSQFRSRLSPWCCGAGNTALASCGGRRALDSAGGVVAGIGYVIYLGLEPGAKTVGLR